MLLACGTCHNEDLKSAVVVGLLHISLKILLHLGRLNFWLTVLTGITDPELVFGFHSSHAVKCSDTLLELHGFDSCGKGAGEDAIGFARAFPDIPCCVPNTWRPIFAARHSQRTAQHSTRIWMKWKNTG